VSEAGVDDTLTEPPPVIVVLPIFNVTVAVPDSQTMYPLFSV
jgi:hypothetical protein